MSFERRKHGHIYWTYFHMGAANAITPRMRELFVWGLYAQTETFPCYECRQHFTAMLIDDPPETYANTNVSLFRYTWKLHDKVNRRINVPEEKCWSYEQAYEQYFGSNVANKEENVAIQDGMKVSFNNETQELNIDDGKSVKSAGSIGRKEEGRALISNNNDNNKLIDDSNSGGRHVCNECGRANEVDNKKINLTQSKHAQRVRFIPKK